MPSLRQSVATRTRLGASPRASDALLALGGGSSPVTASTSTPCGSLPQRVGDVVGGRDEAAEDDRVVAVGDELLDQRDAFLSLGRRRPSSASASRARAFSRRRFGSSGSSLLGVGAGVTSSPSALSSSTRSRTSRGPTRRPPRRSRRLRGARAVPERRGGGGRARGQRAQKPSSADHQRTRWRWAPPSPGRRRSRARRRAPSRRARGTRGERVGRLGTSRFGNGVSPR